MFSYDDDGRHTATCDECGKEFALPQGDLDVAFRPTERETLIVGLFAYGWVAAGRDTVLCPTHIWLLGPTDGVSLKPLPHAPAKPRLLVNSSFTHSTSSRTPEREAS